MATPTHTTRFNATALQQALHHVAVPSVPLIAPARHARINLLLQSQSASLPIPCTPETTILSLQSLSLTSASCRQPRAGLAEEELMVYLEEN